MNLREYIFRYRRTHHLRTQVAFPHWERVRTVLLLCEYSTDPTYLQALQACQQELASYHKESIIWAVSPDKRPKEPLAPLSPYGTIWYKNDFSLWHSPQKPLQAALQTPFDLLIDFTQQPLLTHRYIALYTQSSFKVGQYIEEGKSMEGDGIHDLLIHTEQSGDILLLFRQATHYLTQIQSND